MASSRIKKAEPCAHENCGSRRFYIGDDGYTYCDQGHQQSERGTVIAEDTGELVTLGRKSKRKDSDAESTTTKASTFSGADAFEHHLLCIQLVLRKQLRWLIDVQKLPQELEMLVNDLWSLRLQKLQRKVSYESETDTEAPSSQVFSSQSESEGISASQSSRRSRRDNTKPKEGTPNLVEILSLCYIGILLLRIPITVSDIHEWIDDGELLYYRGSREVPLGMRQRLPPQYQALLEPQELLRPEALHGSVLSMLILLNNEFGMSVPLINTPLLLYRWIRSMVLPIEIFAASKRLAQIIKIDMTFSASKSCRTVVLRYPEVQLMALVVVATKLLFSLDNRIRKTKANTDLSALAIDWDGWVKLHEDREQREDEQSSLTFEQAFEFNEADALEASDDKLDSYLEWCETNIATEEIREHGRAGKDANFRKALFHMFPLRTERQIPKQKPSPFGRRDRERMADIAHMRPTSESTHKDATPVGSFYRRFKTLEELSGPSKVLFSLAAKLAGVSLEGMVHTVFLTERKLQKHEDRLRKDGATELSE
ncbi:hypothetical protein LTR37_014188 [Vermiconidia calcicola]|uniref:Uncharacterized protein n=1 Tax=Vermiconidia calcicola TaxID=1690605 RepID=A0ACC3MUB0_9PEZI|nr:hypothetical protein LTR37_014188 [Vermiconidia calcicola]